MLEKKVAEQLADKLLQYGCNVGDVDTGIITAASVDFWANCTDAHAADFYADGEEADFSDVELFAITALAAVIAAVLNSK